ncbi:tumor necrosis factor receptor superfamily member 19L isoform X2 [Phacochoerus africanus]|uniref:tumor necrosis factor receptor superfamily member 19L isoform X2 n=1 Tax=Phacochoerus africanus TaxID=41426 RepID=UPI001FD8F9BD|nr:tumor necrosis factor receptor superfamily member 19L isoform X2 [Phacochoerus africanus]
MLPRLGPRAAGCLWKRQEALPPLGSPPGLCCPGRLAPDRAPPPLRRAAGAGVVNVPGARQHLPSNAFPLSCPALSWKQRWEDGSCPSVLLRLSLPSICPRRAGPEDEAEPLALASVLPPCACPALFFQLLPWPLATPTSTPPWQCPPGEEPKLVSSPARLPFLGSSQGQSQGPQAWLLALFSFFPSCRTQGRAHSAGPAPQVPSQPPGALARASPTPAAALEGGWRPRRARPLGTHYVEIASLGGLPLPRSRVFPVSHAPGRLWVLGAVMSVGSAPDVAWRWQRGPAVQGRRGSPGTALGPAVPRRRRPSTRSLPSCPSSASWGCWASWCVTCSSGRATTAPPTRRWSLAPEAVEAAVRPRLGSGAEARGHGLAWPARPCLGATRGNLLGLEGLTRRGLIRRAFWRCCMRAVKKTHRRTTKGKEGDQPCLPGRGCQRGHHRGPGAPDHREERERGGPGGAAEGVSLQAAGADQPRASAQTGSPPSQHAAHLLIPPPPPHGSGAGLAARLLLLPL